MPLIYCPDCAAAISDAAIACPYCARPIAIADPLQQLAAANRSPAYESQPTGDRFRKVQTIERTAKRWKVHLLLSRLCIICGIAAVGAYFVMLSLITNGTPPGQPRPDSTREMRLELLFGGCVLAVGILWNAWARFMAWWHHG